MEQRATTIPDPRVDGGGRAEPAELVTEPQPAPPGMRPWNEMYDASGAVRPACRRLEQRLERLGRENLEARQRTADAAFLEQGITFTVYDDDRGTERIFPYDIVPRIITAAEWKVLERGLAQRVEALNRFLHDVYHEARILRDDVIPADLVLSCRHYRREMRGVDPPEGTYLTVVGVDLVRLPDGGFAVLEDNLRVPSGASYMLANREIMKRALPSLFRDYRVRSNEHYPHELADG